MRLLSLQIEIDTLGFQILASYKAKVGLAAWLGNSSKYGLLIRVWQPFCATVTLNNVSNLIMQIIPIFSTLLGPIEISHQGCNTIGYAIIEQSLIHPVQCSNNYTLADSLVPHMQVFITTKSFHLEIHKTLLKNVGYFLIFFQSQYEILMSNIVSCQAQEYQQPHQYCLYSLNIMYQVYVLPFRSIFNLGSLSKSRFSGVNLMAQFIYIFCHKLVVHVE